MLIPECDSFLCEMLEQFINMHTNKKGTIARSRPIWWEVNNKHASDWNWWKAVNFSDWQDSTRSFAIFNAYTCTITFRKACVLGTYPFSFAPSFPSNLFFFFSNYFFQPPALFNWNIAKTNIWLVFWEQQLIRKVFSRYFCNTDWKLICNKIRV